MEKIKRRIFDIIQIGNKQDLPSAAFDFFIVFVIFLNLFVTLFDTFDEAQPDKFKNAFSGIWWSVSTLLTVGYGNIYPVTRKKLI